MALKQEIEILRYKHFEVNLSFITSVAIGTPSPVEGDESKSGGVAANISHFEYTGLDVLSKTLHSTLYASSNLTTPTRTLIGTKLRCIGTFEHKLYHLSLPLAAAGKHYGTRSLGSWANRNQVQRRFGTRLYTEVMPANTGKAGVLE